MDRASFDRMADGVRNWGRWGPDDQRGTLNLIDADAIRRGTAAVRRGQPISLGLSYDGQGPQDGAMRFNPRRYASDIATPLHPAQPAYRFSDDVVVMPLQAATQWDALSHVHYDGLLYNGCKACDTLSDKGASRNGIEALARPGITARGVLLDVARWKGVDRLEPHYAIGADELDAVCAHQKVEILPGDIVVLRTGVLRHFTVDHDVPAFKQKQAGVGADCAPWLHARKAAAICADNVADCAPWLHARKAAAICADNVAIEALPADRFASAEVPLPFHMLALRDMGLPLGEMFELDALAEACAEDGVYDFLLSAQPLAFTGAFGSPVNPVAIR